MSSTYLARLLLEKGKLLNGSLEVGLWKAFTSISRSRWRVYPLQEHTLASNSAWGICWSTSFVKSLSGLYAASAILISVTDVALLVVVNWYREFGD